MKTCSNCKQQKPLSDFGRKSRNKDGLQYNCKECCRLECRTQYKNHKELFLKKSKAWSEKNKPRHNALKLKWKEENPDKIISANSKYRSSHRSNRSAHSATYRAKKLQATPAWSDFCSIEDIYDCKQELQSMMQEFLPKCEFHVDHAIPLQGENVCGLHVWWNLQILPSQINLAKGNKLTHNEVT